MNSFHFADRGHLRVCDYYKYMDTGYYLLTMPLEDPSAAHFIPSFLYIPWIPGTAHGSSHL